MSLTTVVNQEEPNDGCTIRIAFACGQTDSTHPLFVAPFAAPLPRTDHPACLTRNHSVSTPQ